VKILLFSVLAVAMIGLMISDGFGEDALGPDYSGAGDGLLPIIYSIILIPILLIIIIVILVVMVLRRRRK
tara:strand:+ start:63 stop:272 length:210 start_codon:yes stop_codon:yes gene_type:complete